MQTSRGNGSGHDIPCSVSGPMWLEQERFLLIPKAHMKTDASPYPTTRRLQIPNTEPCSPLRGQRPSQQEGAGAGDEGLLRVYLAVWGKQRRNWTIKREEMSAVGKYTGKCTLCKTCGGRGDQGSLQRELHPSMTPFLGFHSEDTVKDLFLTLRSPTVILL